MPGATAKFGLLSVCATANIECRFQRAVGVPENQVLSQKDEEESSVTLHMTALFQHFVEGIINPAQPFLLDFLSRVLALFNGSPSDLTKFL
jgi:hypothetical protein